MSLGQGLVKTIRTMDGIESGRKHFFFAGKCTNQAKPLLPRFSAVFAVSYVRTGTLHRAMKTRLCNSLPGQPNSMRRAASQEKSAEAAKSLTASIEGIQRWR